MKIVFFFVFLCCNDFSRLLSRFPFINSPLGLALRALVFTDIVAGMKKDVGASRTVKIEIIITCHLLSNHEMLLNHAHWAIQFHSVH